MNIMLLTSIVTLLASFVAVLSGFGAGTVIVSILPFWVPFTQTVLLSTIMHWTINLITFVFFWRGLDQSLISYFAIPAVITTILGARLLMDYQTSKWLLPCFGAFLIAYVVFLLIFPNFKVRKNKTNMITGGLLSGFSKGLFGIGGGIRTAVLSAYNLPKESYLSTGAAINLIIDSVRLATYWYQGATLMEPLKMGLPLFIGAVVLGGYGAKRLVDVIPQRYFRSVILIFLFIAGLNFLFNGTH